MFKLFSLSMQPYMEEPSEIGGGNTSPETTPNPEPGSGAPSPEPDPEPSQYKLKLKFNHEEMEIDEDKARELAQKGMNYDKAIERARQEATDQWIANQGYEWNGKPITTEAQYKQALAEKAEYERRESLKENGIDPSIVDEYVSKNPTVQKAAELIKAQEKQQNQAREYGEFLEFYQTKNKRQFDSSTEHIPQEVWLMTAEVNPDGTPNRNRKSLKDAYAEHWTNSLEVKIAEYEAKFKAQETNQANANSSPGSVTGNGAPANGFFTAEQVRGMTKEQVRANFSAIEESMKKW